jgi:hypothetical protein
LEPGFKTQAFGFAAFMSADFFGAPGKEKCRAPFSGDDRFRRDAVFSQALRI